MLLSKHHSFDHQLENFGVNTAELKKPAATRIFRAWLEEWEEELLQQNDCVAEARLLEKYKNLVFYDPDNDTTYTVCDKNLEFHRKNKKKGIDGGWSVIGVDDEEDYEPFVIGKMLIELIADHEQAPGVEIVRLEE
jgi:hypothetical protein